jgi:hypothetical protein
MTRWFGWVLALVCCMAAPLAVAQSRFSLTTQIGHLRVVEGFESVGACLEAVGRVRPGTTAFIEVAEAERDSLTVDELAALCLVGPQVGPGRYALGPASVQDAPAVAAAMSPERAAPRHGMLRIHAMPEGGARRTLLRIHPMPAAPAAAAATGGAGVLLPWLELLQRHGRLMREAEHQPSYRAQAVPPPQAIVPVMQPLRVLPTGKLPPDKP